jgi:hypothetical protein
LGEKNDYGGDLQDEKKWYPGTLVLVLESSWYIKPLLREYKRNSKHFP